MQETPIQFLNEYRSNRIFIKRDDLIPFSFGGNKARKAVLFFEEFDKGEYDCIVTYGSSHSNHCRVIANGASKRNVPCIIIGPKEMSEETNNSKLMRLLGTDIISVPIEDVHNTIEKTIDDLIKQGKKPYFIQGGGHGNIGTQAYVNCYNEIKHFEKDNNTIFDYVFFASGTGTTQAGLVCGELLAGDNKTIVGISIARKNPRGRDVVIESIKEYLAGADYSEEEIQTKAIFVDDYIGAGYGRQNDKIIETIKFVMCNYGIPLDSTYTGKAFYGMTEYIKKNRIIGKNILFIHTGGTPLFFDDLDKCINGVMK